MSGLISKEPNAFAFASESVPSISFVNKLSGKREKAIALLTVLSVRTIPCDAKS